MLSNLRSPPFLCLLLLLGWLICHIESASAAPPKGYKACIQMHKDGQRKKTISCICRFQQTHNNKPIYIYHLGLNHELASRKPKRPVPQPKQKEQALLRFRHKTQALLRFQEYLASMRPGAPRLDIAKRAVARIKRNHKQAWLLLQDVARLPRGTTLRLTSATLLCEGQLTRMRLHCQDRTGLNTSPLDSCVWKSSQKLLHRTKPFELPAGTYQMTLQAPGHIPHRATLRLAPDKHHTQRLGLRKFASLRVRTVPSQSQLLLKHSEGPTHKAASPHRFANLAPGKYTLTSQKRGHTPKTLKLSLAAGHQGGVWLHLTPKPTLGPRLLLSSGLVAGVAVLSLVGGLILGSTALHEHRQAQTFAYQTENWRGRYDQAQSIALAGHILLFAAGVTGATAFGLLAGGLHTQRRDSPQDQSKP